MAAVHVSGLAELQRALRSCEKDVRLGVRRKLRDVAEPVRLQAESLARSDIRNIGPAWSQMRVGVTSSLVYVAPKQRGAKSGPRKRHNMFGLLDNRVLQPALEAKRDDVERDLERALDEILDRNW